MGLASTLADLAGKKQIFREEAAKLFCETRLSATSELLEEFSFVQRANPVRSLVSDLRLCRFLTLNYDVQIEEEFRRLYRTSGASRSEVLPSTRFSGDQGGTQSVGTDEKRLVAPAHKSVPEYSAILDREKPETAFDVLCGGSKMYHRALDLPRRVEYADGASRSVLSVSMSAENISDLDNFALHPRQYVGQGVHLHGRYDKPEDMVMTDEDNRLRYMRTCPSPINPGHYTGCRRGSLHGEEATFGRRCFELLREIELKLTAGDDVASACCNVGISDATY